MGLATALGAAATVLGAVAFGAVLGLGLAAFGVADFVEVDGADFVETLFVLGLGLAIVTRLRIL